MTAPSPYPPPHEGPGRDAISPPAAAPDQDTAGVTGPAVEGRPHPPYDPELAPLVAPGAVDGHSLNPHDITRLRALNASWRPDRAQLAGGGAVWPEERLAPGRDGRPDVPVLILWPTTPYAGPRPVVLACHGGGLVTGDAYSGAPGLAGWVAELGVVAVSPDYRLAPEHPYPAALDDICTVLTWLYDDALPLGLDTARLGVFGVSAGAGLAAATCLRRRDEHSPMPAFQVLQDPMLDDRQTRPSTYEHLDSGAWDRRSSQTAWTAYLGAGAGGPDVPLHAAPGRAADDPALLAGLPPTFLDIGSADLFRDDALALGCALAQAGVPTEMHLWPGGWHGFSEMAPHTRLGQTANATRTRWLAERVHG